MIGLLRPVTTVTPITTFRAFKHSFPNILVLFALELFFWAGFSCLLLGYLCFSDHRQLRGPSNFFVRVLRVSDFLRRGFLQGFKKTNMCVILISRVRSPKKNNHFFCNLASESGLMPRWPFNDHPIGRSLFQNLHRETSDQRF